MFTKPTKDQSAPEAAAPRKPVAASLIAPGVQIRGDVAAEGDLHLDGVVEGDVSVTLLTIGESGGVTGAIKADTVEVRGHVTGSISARQVRLCASARVDGDITHAELSVEAGAHFVGRSLMLPEATVTPLIVAAE